MFLNYLITSFRFLKRHKLFVFINFIGLTAGFTTLILILFFVLNELSFDKFHTNAKNIYRINFAFEDNSGSETILVNSPPALVPGIRGKFPELAKASVLRYAQNCMFSYSDNQFYENKGYFADSSFLDILQFKFLSGDPQTALDEPNSIVLTQDLALKYFNNDNPIGATLLLNNSTPLKVTGIISSIPVNSHLDFDFLISFSNYIVPDGYASDLESWTWLGFLTYVELIDGTDPVLFQNKLYQLFDDLTPGDDQPMKPIVQNILDIYLGSNHMTDDLSSHIRTGNEQNISAMAVIALLILIVAGFNYSILTNALSLRRIKPLGIRKVFGANRATLMMQLLIESTLLSTCCLLISYGMAIFILYQFAPLLGWNIPISGLLLLKTFPVMLITSLIIGMIAGIYPALNLSRYDIARSLKGELKTQKNSLFQLRNIIVLLQFSISIGLIATTFIFIEQVSYLKNKSLGYDKDNLIIIKLLPDDMTRYFSLYKSKLIQNAGVLDVTRSDRAAGDPWPFSVALAVGQDPQNGKIVYFNQTDYDYFSTMGIKINQGRSFSREFSKDSTNAIIINNKAAELLGFDEPVGKNVHFFDLNGPRTIVGVTNDFNYVSLHNEIGPAVMVLPFIDLEYMYVRMAPGTNLSAQINLLENVWMEITSTVPLEWQFVDDTLNQLYNSERILSYVIGGFALLAILLASLGLYGIVAFMINSRIKEFGIRKVLGASVFSIYKLYIKQYLYQIVLATFIVTPILHYYLNSWLQKFAYRIEIQWYVYPMAMLILTIIAMLTITFQTLKAAKVDPVKLIKSE